MNEKKLCSLIRRLKIVNMAGSIPQNNLKSNKIPFNIPADFFCRNGQANSKIHVSIQSSQNNLSVEEQGRRTHSP